MISCAHLRKQPDNIRHGYSFIEVLISLFLLSITLIGIDAIGITAFRQAEATYDVNVANQQLRNLIERLKITSKTQLDFYIQQWNYQNQQLLPKGEGIILSLEPLHIKLWWGNTTSATCTANISDISGCLQIKMASY